MKKMLNIFVIFIMLIPTFCIPDITHAETLGDLKNKLQQKQDEYAASEQKKELTKEQIARTNNEITGIKNSISQTYIDIENLNKDIEALRNKIADKKAEVKKILNFVQVSSGVSSYLEYIFGAESFTELIYRSAVAEQMSAYNEKLVKEYNELIEQSEKKQVEISNKQVELGKYKEELESKAKTLGEELEAETATSIDIQEDIKAQKEIIKVYQDMGCKDNESIKTCGRKILPPGTAFYRPLMASRGVTSEWGYRSLGFHEGIDFAATTGTTVYSAATGKVMYIFTKNSCGGNMVVIHHNINGKAYTTVYAHLSSIAVSEKQTVTRDTIIGYSGGGPSTQAYNPCTKQSGPGWDRCSCGEHLHLTVAEGLYGTDYGWNAMNYTYSRNPRNYIYLPAGLYHSWSDRISAY